MFSKPTASPWQREQPHRFPAARANHSPRHGRVVTGRANHWAVGPKTITLFISHQGDALGWETKRAFGPQMPCCANQTCEFALEKSFTAIQMFGWVTRQA